MKNFQEKKEAALAFMAGDYWRQFSGRFANDAGYTLPKLDEIDPYHVSELMKAIFPLHFSRADDDGMVRDYQLTMDEFFEIVEALQGNSGIPKLKLN